MARRGRLFGRMSSSDFDAEGPAGLRHRHLLLLPSTVGAAELDVLIRSRLPHSDLAATGEVSIGRRSRLAGPFELTMEDAVDAAVPMPWTLVYALQAPVERESPPLPGVDDRDGFAYAFPDGLPWREEGRGLHLLVALARRLHGAVRVADGVLVQPDPDRSVDVLIHSPVWLDPSVVHGLVLRVLPTARLAVEGHEWGGPGADVYDGTRVAAETAHDPLSTAELRALHAAADDLDLAHLRGEPTVDAFAVVADLDGTTGAPGPDDGAVEVLVHVTEPGEPAVADQPWGADRFVTYEVRWGCAEPEERERRQPSDAYLASRERVRPVLTAVARVLVEATGGVVTDEDGLRIDRYTL